MPVEARPLTDEERAAYLAERERQGFPAELSGSAAERVAAVMRPGLDDEREK